MKQKENRKQKQKKLAAKPANGAGPRVPKWTGPEREEVGLLGARFLLLLIILWKWIKYYLNFKKGSPRVKEKG